ncbi:MAG: LysM peptidoglycan-binding domain-containing protein, partial [Chloroflexi bacterium]
RYQHYVSYGENLSSISAWYGVNPWAVAQANNLYNLHHIYAGTYLSIP